MRVKRDIGGVLLLVILVGGGLAFWQFHQADQRDLVRESDLATLQSRLQPAATANTLPAALPPDLPTPSQTNHPYIYKVDRKTFLVCTTFERRHSGEALFVTQSGRFYAERKYCQQPLEPRIAGIVTAAGLTPAAIKPFLENSPQLADGTTVKRECQLGSAGEVLFGCYLGDQRKIWILDVSDPSLANVNIATAMHELMHALEATDPPPADQLEAEAARLADPGLDQELSLYTNEERTSELAARIGTQFTDLPKGLTDYYGRYFNQPAVAAAYRPYGILVNQVTRLQSQLESDRQALDRLKAAGRISEYNARVDAYNDQVERYNALAARYNLAGQ